MTDKERLDLMMATNLSGIVKEDFSSGLRKTDFSLLRQAPSTTVITRAVCSTIPLW